MFEGRPEKNPPEKKFPGGKNVIWVGTKAQAPTGSDEKLVLRRLHREKEIRTADPTRLNAWHLEKKELNKEKIKWTKGHRYFWSLDDNHVLYPVLYTTTSLPMMPRPGTQAPVLSPADKIAPVAQLVGHRVVTREVVSSTPTGPTLRVLK